METPIEKENVLAPGFILRSTRWADIKPITDLILDVLTADNDVLSRITPQEMEDDWKGKDFNHETDAWVVTTSDGRIVGYEEFEHRHAHAYLTLDGYVHPEFRGNNIGMALLRKAEGRAREEMQLAEPDLRVYIRAGTNASDKNVRSMFEGEGYRSIRYYWMMEINLTEAPKDFPFPDGIELRPFIKGEHDRFVFEADNEAFRDHWGYVPGNFDEWKQRRLGKDDFDAKLWHIAWDGNQIAGYSLTRFRNGIGWVGRLGVRRPWRKRGLGEALLLHSFNEFYKHGMSTVGLGVDASNPTGATRLYQRVGMNVAVEDVVFEKELRPGRELVLEE